MNKKSTAIKAMLMQKQQKASNTLESLEHMWPDTINLL